VSGAKGDDPMKRHAFFLSFLAAAALAPLLLSAPAEKKLPVDGFKQVSRDDLEVTDGKVGESKDGFLTVEDPEVRGTQKAISAKGARLVFTYLGEPKQVAKLASGNVAHQLGLKLRAKNTCNLLYVMWKIEDQERIAVSVKRNPDKSTHKECGANGYISIKPAILGTLPSAKDGKSHTLEAQLLKKKGADYELVVKADGVIVWQGPIEAKLLNDIDGPPGFRSDNAKFKFKFYSQP
jgi:hypothetical protein